MIKGRALDHIGIACTDVEANVKWYMDVLGFTLMGKAVSPGKKYPTYFIKNPDGSSIYEMYQKDGLDPMLQGKIDHIAYVSDDIERDYAFCVEQGYKIASNGIESISTRWENGVRYFKIASPTGEEIEFSQTL